MMSVKETSSTSKRQTLLNWIRSRTVVEAGEQNRGAFLLMGGGGGGGGAAGGGGSQFHFLPPELQFSRQLRFQAEFLHDCLPLTSPGWFLRAGTRRKPKRAWCFPAGVTDSGPEVSRTMLGFLLLLLSAASADPDIYGQEGGEVELKPKGAPPTITTITWKFESDVVVDWDEKSMDYYRHFKGRAQLNTSTGAVVLRSLIRNDSGQYTPTISAKTLKPVQLSVISAVPVPSIKASCNEERTLCQMTCEADTAGAEPATFVWRKDGQEVQRPTSRTLEIQKNDSSVKEFICELRNPVSQESSSSSNPFSEPPGSSLNIPVGVTVFVVLLVLVLLLGVVHRIITGSWFYQKDSMPWEADFWRRNGSPERRTSVPMDDDAASEKD